MHFMWYATTSFALLWNLQINQHIEYTVYKILITPLDERYWKQRQYFCIKYEGLGSKIKNINNALQLSHLLNLKGKKVHNEITKVWDKYILLLLQYIQQYWLKFHTPICTKVVHKAHLYFNSPDLFILLLNWEAKKNFKRLNYEEVTK